MFLLVWFSISAEAAPRQGLCHKLVQLLNNPTSENSSSIALPFRISRKVADQTAQELRITKKELMKRLVLFVQKKARPPISNYYVGEVGEGASGALYLSVNLEFPGHELAQTVHGEQFLIALMILHGEKGIRSMALPAEPCEHCRQFLNEILGGGKLKIFIPEKPPMTLDKLLTHSFGSKNLGMKSGLMSPGNHGLKFSSADLADPTSLDLLALLASLALQAANSSYAPYSKSPSGVALLTEDGSVFKGPYLENVPFNPSLSPLQVALVGMVARGEDYSHILKVILVEKKDASISQEANIRKLLATIAPQAELKVYKVRKVRKVRSRK